MKSSMKSRISKNLLDESDFSDISQQINSVFRIINQVDSENEIIIEFSENQQEVIRQQCGFIPKPLVTDSLNLVMLSIATSAIKSDVLPLVSSISTCNQILECIEKNLPIQQPFTVKLELTAEQREIIRNTVNKEWHHILIAPDDFEIDFTQAWETEPTIQHLGQSFVIVSEVAEYSSPADEIVIKLPIVNENSNTTFGTGSHPTTQAVLFLMEKYVKNGIKVLDIGTGSGILAVAATKLGAGKVLAIDINLTAVETAKKTVKLNNVSDKIQVKTRSIDIIEDRYDLVTANLFPKIIISLAKSLANAVAPNGVLLLSGLVSVRIPEIIQIMKEVGLEHLESITIDFWGGIAFLKKNQP